MRLFLMLCSLLCLPASAAETELILRGTLRGDAHQTYVRLPFTVPPGAQRLTLEFDYTGKEQRSVIDLGLFGPNGDLRGWSGGNKRLITISTVDATPSYLPTSPMAGTWGLLLGVPNMRAGAQADYTAKLTFSMDLAASSDPAVLRAPLRNEARWYRGDLHSHTAHSDGSCANTSGTQTVPCPAFLTAQAAASRKLDFVAVTDHNGVGHAHALRELQPYFDQVLLMPGRELTSFSGHANLYGTLAPVDFRVTKAGQSWNDVLAASRKAGGIVSLNHAVRPSGEACMGCGWEAPQTDMSLVSAIEAVNGADADTEWSALAYWQAQLARGYRITAIGGSDNHRITLTQSGAQGGALGMPTTVVYARELSQAAILDGIRAGRVYVDVQGAGRTLEWQAQTGGAQAGMGEALAAPAGAKVRFTLRATGSSGGRFEVLADGKPAPAAWRAQVQSGDDSVTVDWTSDGKPHWWRADVRDAAGKLVLLGNPVYLNYPAAGLS
ncbi:MAG TPA: CehA/McbA family metallohydrolase, partial [Burkholderiaceae bacterium]